MTTPLELVPAGSDDASGEPWVAWVGAARAGDQAAFERLYHRFHRVVKGLVIRHRQVHAADDVVQEVFMTAWRRLDALHEDAAFPGWLATIARRAALDAGRSDARRGGLAVVDPDDRLEAIADPGSPMADAVFVLRAIRSLPDAYVEPLLLRLVAGCSGPEIARLTDLTPGSVRVNLHRGLALLRRRLEEEQP